MSLRIQKLGGAGSAVLGYLREEAERAFEYYSEGRGNEPDSIAFDRVWGSGAAELGLELGMTRQQFLNLYDGRFEGKQLTQYGYHFVYERDEDGNLLLDDNGEKIHVMEQALTRKGNPRFDRQGHPILKRKTERAHNGATDIPLGAPKSVAELMVRADDKLRAAVDEVALRAGYATAMAIQDVAKVARVPLKEPAMAGAGADRPKKDYSETERIPGGWIFVPTIGRAARDTAESLAREDPVPDAQYHLHLTALSPVFADGRWLTADTYHLFQPEVIELANATWMGEFARGLEELGIELEYDDWDKAKNGRVSWEVADSNEGLCREWSSNTRRRQGLQDKYLKEHNRPPSKEKLDELMRETRVKKSKLTKEMDSRPAYDRWLQQAADLGYKLAPARIREPLRRVSVHMRERSLADRLFGPNGLHRNESTFGDETIRATLTQAAVGLGFSPEDLGELEVKLREQLVVRRDAEDPRNVLYATPKQLHLERTLKKALDRRVKQVTPVPSAAARRWAIGQAKVDLDEGQRRALKTATTGHRVTVIQGVPGAGKSSLLETLKKAYDAEKVSDQWLVAAYAGKIGIEIGRKVGADRYGSIDSVIFQLENGARPTKRTVVVVDEAWRASTEQIVRLERACGEAHVIFLGDESQLPSIGPSGFMSEFVAEHPNRVSTLNTSHRFKDHRAAADYDLMRKGGPSLLRALENMEARDCVHTNGTYEESIGAMFDRYVELRDKGNTAAEVRFIVDGSNQGVDTLNRLAQNDRIRRGEIKDSGFAVEDTRSGRRWTLYEGDQVTFRRTLQTRQATARNGDSGTILSLDDRGKAQVILEGTTEVVTIKLRREELEQPAEPNYGLNVSKFQGGQVKYALTKPAGQNITSNNSLLTQVTRGVAESHVFLDQEHYPAGIKDLAKSCAETEVKETAHSRLRDMAEPAVEFEEDLDQDLNLQRDTLNREDDLEREPLEREGLEREELRRDGLEVDGLGL